MDVDEDQLLPTREEKHKYLEKIRVTSRQHHGKCNTEHTYIHFRIYNVSAQVLQGRTAALSGTKYAELHNVRCFIVIPCFCDTK